MSRVDPSAVPIPLVYVAGPFSAHDRGGIEANIREAERWGVEIAKLGAMPVVPHANTSHVDYEAVQPYDFWIRGTAQLLKACNACFLTPRWRESSGARGEEELAKKIAIEVFYDGDLEAVRKFVKSWEEAWKDGA